MADAIERQIREQVGLPSANVGGTAPPPEPAPEVDPVTGEVL